MDLLVLLKAAVLGIVEGLTEFLPVSSTGHLIVSSSLLGFRGANVPTFEIAIQTGAMCAVIWEYRKRLAQLILGAGTRVAHRFALNVAVAFTPAVIAGLTLGKLIQSKLFHPVPVALAFVIGGFVILWVEAIHKRRYGERDLQGQRHARVETVDDMTVIDALKVGLIQCLALIPGTSRSGATIIGGMVFGLSRRAATEFSFYLAVPTLIGAGAYAMWKQREVLATTDVPLFAVGLVFAFASALVCIRWLIRFISTHDFTPFAWYRIAFGGFILLTASAGWLDWAR